jgi:hypothetical protein
VDREQQTQNPTGAEVLHFREAQVQEAVGPIDQILSAVVLAELVSGAVDVDGHDRSWENVTKKNSQN